MHHEAQVCGDLHAGEVNTEGRAYLNFMVGHEAECAKGVQDSPGVDIAVEGEGREVAFVEDSLVLIDELIETVDGATLVDEVDAIVGQIVAVGQFDTVQEDGKLSGVGSGSLNGDVGEILVFIGHLEPDRRLLDIGKGRVSIVFSRNIETGGVVEDLPIRDDDEG